MPPLARASRKHSVQIKAALADPPVHELRHSEYIEVAMKSGHLAPRYQQQVIEERLQLAQVIIMRVGIVVSNRNEIQAARRRCLHRQKQRTRHLAAALALAAAVAMRRVHMQITAIPPRSRGQGLGGESRVFGPGVKAYFCLVVRNHLWAHVRNRDDQPPLPGRNRTREIRRRGIRLADSEMAFVSAAFSTKALRVGDAEIQSSALIPFGVVEVDADAMHTGRHHKRDF